MAISDNIRTIRKKKGLTQKQVAEACGMFDTAIRAYELGKANPKPATVARIAKALDVSPAELYGVDWLPGADVVNQETGSALFQSVLNDQGGTLPIDDPNKVRLLIAFDKLNRDGQIEAIKRTEELTQIPVYQLQQTPLGITVTLTQEELEVITAKKDSILKAEHELELMAQMGTKSGHAVTSNKQIIARAQEHICEIMLSHLRCPAQE